MMKTTLLLVCLILAVSVSALPQRRAKRQAYELPDGAELLVGAIRTSFTCQSNGYFADVENECRIFHVCNTNVNPDGTQEVVQYSFLCGNQTVFNQLSLTCAYPDEAVPCSSARDFFYVNQNIGIENAPFLTDQDVERAIPLIAAYSGAGRGAAPARPAAPPPPPGRPGGFRG